MVNFQLCLERIKQCQPLCESDLKAVFEYVGQIFSDEANVLRLNAPCYVVGDIHGQFYDLKEMFKVVHGDPTEDTQSNQFLFLGDYVDRGYYSIETLTYLLLLKILHPQRVHILRGNHETRGVTWLYGFQQECISKYGHMGPWRWAIRVFDLMPVAAVIDGRVYCVHGGLSPDAEDIDRLTRLDRVTEPPPKGALSDMLWSDPGPVDEYLESGRGAGYLFGSVPVKRFCHRNGLDLIARAHQMVQTGYRKQFEDRLVTVWSAPAYMYRFDNGAAVMHVQEHKGLDFTVFSAAPEDARVRPNADAVWHYL